MQTASNKKNLASGAGNSNIVSVTAPETGIAVINIRGRFAADPDGAGKRKVGFRKNKFVPSPGCLEAVEWLFIANGDRYDTPFSVPLLIDVNAGDVISGYAYHTSDKSILECSMRIDMMIFPM